MKKVKYAFGAVAIITAALTMSFTMTNNDANSTDAQNDCWSSIQLHEMEEPPDRSTIDCPNLSPGCCVKPDPENPEEYLQFSEN